MKDGTLKAYITFPGLLLDQLYGLLTLVNLRFILRETEGKIHRLVL